MIRIGEIKSKLIEVYMRPLIGMMLVTPEGGMKVGDYSHKNSTTFLMSSSQDCLLPTKFCVITTVGSHQQSIHGRIPMEIAVDMNALKREIITHIGIPLHGETLLF